MSNYVEQQVRVFDAFTGNLDFIATQILFKQLRESFGYKLKEADCFSIDKNKNNIKDTFINIKGDNIDTSFNIDDLVPMPINQNKYIEFILDDDYSKETFYIFRNNIEEIKPKLKIKNINDFIRK